MKNQLGSSFLISSILREAKRISEDHTLVLSLLLAPIFYAFFYGSIYLNKTEEEVEIVVVDQSRSELSRTFYRMVDETPEVNVVLSTQDFQKAKKMYLLGEVQAVVVIPSSFEKDLKKLHATDVGLFLNTSRFLPSNDINATVTKVALLLGAGVRLQYFELHGDNESLSITKAQPITMHDKTVFVTPSTYGGFLLPGLLLLILQQTFLIGLAESTARERV